jgi:starvation-inducible DNA-binding protein
MDMLKTRNDIKSNTRKAVCALLNERLADTIDLALATKQAHWNLRGPGFIGVHEMLDKFRKDLDTHIDVIAERVSQLGGLAQGTVQGVAAASALKPYPADLVDLDQHVAALGERYAACGAALREAIDKSDELGDANAADILTAASRSVDKALWMLEAHQPAA